MSNAQVSDLVKAKQAYRYGFREPEHAVLRADRGLSRAVVDLISQQKNDPAWMRQLRYDGLESFQRRPLPTWGADLTGLNFDEICYYIKPADRKANRWDDVPSHIKRTFDRLKVPQYEQEFLAGVGAQYDSENIYHNILPALEQQGVIFTDVETATQKYPDLVREHFAKVVSPQDNKFAALNTAVWSGGSFVYIPKGVHVELPLQAYFRINASGMGQFERTLIIADEGSFVHYVEGCSAPIYQVSSLHSAVVEIYAKRGARVRYTTVQNWSKNVYNLVTKRARAEQEATVEWVDFNFGSQVTMKYPAVFLVGRGARADILSMAFAGAGQHQDAGGKAVHVAPDTTSVITSKSISQGGGRTSYRGLLQVAPSADRCKSKVTCDALILDSASASDTYPTMKIANPRTSIEHEATVTRISADQLFYLQARGLPPTAAAALIVNGFIEPLVKELPLEYAVEMNRLIELEMEGSVG